MLKLFTVYDSKGEIYRPPFAMVSTGAAIRGFITILNDPASEHSKYPADFTLFEVGSFDETNCKLVIHEALINLGNGLHLQPKGKFDESATTSP